MQLHLTRPYRSRLRRSSRKDIAAAALPLALRRTERSRRHVVVATGQSCGQDHHCNDAARARRCIQRFHNQLRGPTRRNVCRGFNTVSLLQQAGCLASRGSYASGCGRRERSRTSAIHQWSSGRGLASENYACKTLSLTARSMAHGHLLPRPKTPLLRMRSTAAGSAMAFTPQWPNPSSVGHHGWDTSGYVIASV